MPRNPASSDSDSDTEEEKRRRQQLRESVEENLFAFKKPEPAVTSAPAAGAAAASAAADASGSSGAPAAAAANASNPFYALLNPPMPPFFQLPPQPVPERLKTNPLRVAFLAHIEAQLAAARLQLERRRRNALHGLTSNRCGGDEDDLAASAPRVLNAFEQSMLKNLSGHLARTLEVEDEAWPEETDDQRDQRVMGEEAQKKFVVLAKFPPGTFLDAELDLVGSTSFPTAAQLAAAATAAPAVVIDEDAARRQRKLERRAEKIAAAGGDPNAVETPEQRRIRKELKREKKRRLEAQAAGVDQADHKSKKKKHKDEPAPQQA